MSSQLKLFGLGVILRKQCFSNKNVFFSAKITLLDCILVPASGVIVIKLFSMTLWTNKQEGLSISSLSA
jgi:hypothetical protein